jgi:tryptophan synthase alpha chain
LLISPTTTERRRVEIAKLCSGFAYYLSVSGITGARERLPEGLEESVRRLRGEVETPICVGFGISRAEHVRQLKGVADGAIVGSAYVKRLKENAGSEAGAVEAYTRELLG